MKDFAIWVLVIVSLILAFLMGIQFEGKTRPEPVVYNVPVYEWPQRWYVPAPDSAWVEWCGPVILTVIQFDMNLLPSGATVTSAVCSIYVEGRVVKVVEGRVVK